MRTGFRRMASFGAAIWALGLFWPIADRAPHVALVERIIAFGTLVCVPLALGATGAKVLPGRAPLVVVGAGACVLVSILGWPPGTVAAAFVVPWVVVTFALALAAAHRVYVRRGVRPFAETCIDVGFIYLPVGAFWLMASRLGLRPMGFSDEIVLLTGAHFHYAGLAAPVIAGLTGRALATRAGAPSRTWPFAAALVALGPPLVAAGITFSPIVEVASAIVLAIGMLGVAALFSFEVAPRVPRLAGACLVVAGGSLVVTMALACAYAWSEWTGSALVSIPTMANIHGVANSFGFAFPALLAFNIAPQDEIVAAPGAESAPGSPALPES